MIFLSLFPLLLLILPADINDILLYFVLYFLCSIILQKDKQLLKNHPFNKRRLVCSVIINSIFSLLFFIKWSSSSIVLSVTQKLYIGINVFVILISFVLFILSIPAVYMILEYIECIVKKSEKTTVYYFFSSSSIAMKGKVIASTFLIVLFWILQGKLPIYADLDNYQNSLILNGLFSDDNYCNFVSPILATIVRIIDSVIPTLDGYVFVMEVSMLLAIWLLIYTLFCVCKRNINVVVIWTILVALNYNVNILHCNFTIYSAALTAIGFFVLFACIRKKVGIVFGILGLVIVCVGSIFRLKAQLLFIPFVLLVVLFEGVTKKKMVAQYLKRGIPLLIIASICVGGNLLINNVTAFSDKYNEAVTFSSNRSALFDYETKSYKEVSNELSKINVSENDYAAVKKSFLADTDIITSDYLSEIHNIVKEEKNFDGLGNFVFTFSSMLFFNQLIATEFFGFIIFLVFLSLFTNISCVRIIELILGLLGSILIAVYFSVFVGRMPWYLLVSILLGNWLVLICVLMFDDIKLVYRLKGNFIIAFILGLSVFYAFTGSITATNVDGGKILDCVTAKPVLNVDDSDNHDKFIWETSSYNDYIKENFWNTNTLTTSEFFYNNIPDKKSFYGQVYFNDYLNKINVKNPAKALFEDNVYYVSDESNYDLMFTFLKEHYNSKLKVKKVRNMSDVSIWKFYS